MPLLLYKFNEDQTSQALVSYIEIGIMENIMNDRRVITIDN